MLKLKLNGHDILINKEKISGIISEIFSIKGDKYINTGFGVNIVSSPKIENYPTTNINKYNKEINNFYFVYEIMEEYFNNVKQLLNNHDKIMTEYKSRLLYLGSNINLKIDEQNVKQGIFYYLNPDGSITLKNNINFENIYNARII